MTVFACPNPEQAIQDLLAGPSHPDKEFVTQGATFGEVYEEASGLASLCKASELSTTPVCLATKNRATMAAALLFSLAGGPTLLLPYAFSTAVLEQLQRQTGFKAAIADQDIALPGGVIPIHPQMEKARWNNGFLKSAGKSELLRIFTGGSTDAPQIWSKTGINIFGEALFLAHRFGMTQDDRIVATVPPYHIYGLLFSVVLPLVASAAVSNDTPSFPGEIDSVVNEERASVLAAVRAHYRALKGKKLTASHLRLAFSSAGMLDQADGEAFFKNNKVGVVEVYGSTETGGVATRDRSRSEQSFTAFQTVDWRIRQDRLGVRSPYISPDLPLDEEGFFLTADRVSAVGQNGFSLLGRADTVTKVGGKRVDLDQVRSIIKGMEGVHDCAVISLSEDSGRGNRIGALVETKKVQKEQIAHMLNLVLETYAQPRVIRIVDRIPVKENGKYDREAIINLLNQ